MAEEQLQIAIDEKRTVTAIRSEPEGRTRHGLFVYAPGAGSNVHDPFGRYTCRRLAAEGITSFRFQFPYMEAKRRAPDRTAVLEATWRAVIEAVRVPGEKLIAGGRSMGGRIATQVVAQGERVDAVALFAYPLHSPAHPDQWRDAHLPSISVPTLFCSGTRDAFAAPDELRAVAAKMKSATVHLLDAADHGYAVLAASGRKREDIWTEAVDMMMDWLQKKRVIA
jgi:predicted alpha/beta-hydrolase family hydrolase